MLYLNVCVLILYPYSTCAVAGDEQQTQHECSHVHAPAAARAFYSIMRPFSFLAFLALCTYLYTNSGSLTPLT